MPSNESTKAERFDRIAAIAHQFEEGFVDMATFAVEVCSLVGDEPRIVRVGGGVPSTEVGHGHQTQGATA